jgi:hypothetical protein
MAQGEFRAVAKFRRNTCYTPDLSGQLKQGMSQSAVNACRSNVEEIVVSEPLLQSSWPEGEQVLEYDKPRDMTFKFTQNPIPIEATDLYLQVVFRGKLGEEIDAVAVGTKDISEPTFFGVANMRDYEACLFYSDAYCDSLGDWPPQTRAFDMNVKPKRPVLATTLEPYLPFPPYARTTRSIETMDWLGFSRNHPAYKVAKLPRNGLAPGEYVRIALLGDIDQAAGPWPTHIARSFYTGNKTFSLGTYTNPSTGDAIPENQLANFWQMTSLEPNDLPFLSEPSCGTFVNPDGAILSDTGTTGQGYSVVTREGYDGLFFSFGRLRLAQIQANRDTDQIEHAALPRYLRFRGATLGIRVDRQDQPGDYGFLVGDNSDKGHYWTPRDENGRALWPVKNTGGLEFSAIYRFSEEAAAAGMYTGSPLQIKPLQLAGFNTANRHKYLSDYAAEREKVGQSPASKCTGTWRGMVSGRGQYEIDPTRFARAFYGRYPAWDAEPPPPTP